MQLKDLFNIQTNNSLINGFWNDRFKKGQRYPLIAVDCIFGNGKRIRVCTEPITLFDKENRAIEFLPLLIEEPTINESYEWKGGTPSQRTFSITIDARTIDPLSIIFSGDIIAGVAEISLVDIGIPYESRYVFMIGDMISGCEFGANEETMTFDVSDPKLTMDQITPKQIATEERITTLPDNQKGQRYPLIISQFSFVPCIRMTSNAYGTQFLVCYGHDFTIEHVYRNGAQVYPTANYLVNPYKWSVVKTKDQLGTPITVLDFEYSPLLQQDQYVWQDGDTVYAVVTSIKPRLSIVDTVEELLTQHTAFGIQGIDQVLLSRAKGKEPTYLNANVCINGSGENSTTTIEYITNTLLSSFSMIQLAYSSLGIAPIFTDRRSQYRVLHLENQTGLLFDRVSSFLESSKEDMYNVFTLQYDYDAMNDCYKKTIQRNATNHNLCFISQSKIGMREFDPIMSVNIFDEQTANYVIDWYADHYTLPNYTVSYSGSPRLFFLLKVGDNVTLTDYKLNMSNINATVYAIEYQKGQCIISFRLWILFDKVSGRIDN